MAWWDGGAGLVPTAAYEPIGAPDLASSYINRVNPGTYNAAPGVAPTFATGTGWTFNGTTQYLTTGVTPSGAGWTLAVRFSAVTVGINGAWHGSNASGAALYTIASTGGGSFWGYGNGFTSSVNDAAGVMVTAGANAYRDGSLVSTISGSWTGTADALSIGRLTGSTFAPGVVEAMAIYNTTLTAPQVAAVSAAMAALPTGGSWATGAPSVILQQMAHHRAAFGA